jgi:hypothetical protein
MPKLDVKPRSSWVLVLQGGLAVWDIVLFVLHPQAHRLALALTWLLLLRYSLQVNRELKAVASARKLAHVLAQEAAKAMVRPETGTVRCTGRAVTMAPGGSFHLTPCIDVPGHPGPCMPAHRWRATHDCKAAGCGEMKHRRT